ncbi:hypothetical protein WJX73_000781 [Symbiochloris irregularis]|uniref:protein-histidine N-methyltransferase n=1 Tax=Symbiochloris irregularis TaxID=706552 RepID=A0AAW1PCP9_9CHLO
MPKVIGRPTTAKQKIFWSQKVQWPSDLDSIQLTPDLAVRKGNISSAEASTLLKAGEVTASDLLPGRYEGGFKLWECALDLARSLQLNAGAKATSQSLQGHKVIELGCGHGIPGIVALLAGAAVDFQDYNAEVLSRLTCPNVAANCTSSDQAGTSTASAESCFPPEPSAASDAHLGTSGKPPRRSTGPSTRFFAGDWAAMPSFLRSEGLVGTYDLVLSAETIYSQDSLRALHDCILACLKRPHGQALIAAKVHYFGIELGGGVAAFTDLVHRLGTLSAHTMAEGMRLLLPPVERPLLL